MTDDKHRRQWMAMLGKLANPMDHERAIKALCDMLPMLAMLDEKHFTADSLQFVADRCKRTPSYGELRGHLGAYWHSILPPSAVAADAYPALETTTKRRPPTDLEREIAGQAVRSLKAEMSARRSHSMPHVKPVTPRHLNDSQLLGVYEGMLAAGNEMVRPRVELLRNRLGVDAEGYPCAAE